MPWWKHLPFFYGWVIVAASFLCFVVAYTTWHSFAIFFVAVLEEFQWSRAATAAVFSIFTMTYGLSAPLAGTLFDRLGPRVVAPVGATVLGLALLLTSRINGLWEFYLVFGVLAALGLSCSGTVSVFTLLNNWFVKKRGTATGFATAGIGVGMLFLVPLIQIVITAHGWRVAYAALGVAIIVVVPTLSLTFYRSRPQQMGLLPDGDEPDPRPASPARPPMPGADALVVDREWAGKTWTLGMALRNRRYWCVLLARFTELACLQTFLTHQAAFFVDSGYDKLLAASIVGLVGIVGSTGKIVWGIVSDRIGREKAFTVAALFGTAGISILLSIRPGSPIWMLYGYGLVYGLAYGSSAVMIPVLLADMFHGRRYGSILGGVYIGGGMGSAFGGWLGGYIFDLSHSYLVAFALTIPVSWLAVLLVWLAAPRKVRLVAGQGRKAPQLQPEG